MVKCRSNRGQSLNKYTFVNAYQRFVSSVRVILHEIARADWMTTQKQLANLNLFGGERNLALRRLLERCITFDQLSCTIMAMYGCIYFDGDKSLSVVPKSKCILKQSFEEGNEVEVSWKSVKGTKQVWSGVIVKIASKGKFWDSVLSKI